MNNVTFGNERFGYYETLAGAGPSFHGASAVQTWFHDGKQQQVCGAYCDYFARK